MKSLNKWPIRGKITLLSIGIVAFSLLIAGIIFVGYMYKTTEEELSQRSMITAQLIAQMEDVQQALEKNNPTETLQPKMEQIRAINGDDYIVMLNMDGKRLTHPIPERIGTKFAGGDEEPAFFEHNYVSKAQTNDSYTLRAFVPIMNESMEQIGVVVVGNEMPVFFSLLAETIDSFIFVIIFSMAFGTLGSWMLANHLKKQTFQLEPAELARLLTERDATFNAIHEGVLAIDDKENITVMNEAAKGMVKYVGNPVGRWIYDVIPDTRLPEILKVDKPLMQREFFLQDRLIFSNRIPIVSNGKTVGAVAVFQDKTEVTRLARELTGVQSFVDALRVKNHEYSNTLHTIAGLIELGESEKALDYIYERENEETSRSSFMIKQIHNDSVVGLLVGKMSRGRELGIDITINESSFLSLFPEGVNQDDFVVIIGNLIDNSIDAITEKGTDRGEIEVLLQEENDQYTIQVTDNGTGISSTDRELLFERGVSTKKGDERGIGLFLIRSIVDRVEGHVSIESTLGVGTTMKILFPHNGTKKERGRDGQ
ncbi:ATP-binding protein [Texcoconibacillus texcoconensis]|uniref:histidine kinase n=1 Tax=Texcoconibacillus texcoconensis TaxID=1095777 RepID=A0A840QNX0_9BACI|nr:sensor histidine kinase [Texcoconibacillus texcoconensis]MBB5173037.1 two-component system sensor histidine kinase DctS [Texcoconibacillus texcoconensis]